MATVDNQPKKTSDDAAAVSSGDRATLGTSHTGEVDKAPRSRVLLLIVILVGAALIYIVALRPDNFGFAHDDGIYVTTAKALAAGQGYRLINLPYEPAQTKYPPFFPYLLSLVWKVYPQFPQNLLPMLMLNMAATLSFIAVSYRYLVKHGYAKAWQAVAAVSLAAINWRTIVIATTLYSEMVYALLSVLALYLAEEYEMEDRRWVKGTQAGVVIGLAFLTRSLGGTLLIALAIYFLLRRRWKSALIPVGVGSVFVIGWAVWCYINKTTSGGANVAYYTSYVGHISQVITSLHSQSNTPKWLVLFGLLGRNTLMYTLVSPAVLLLGIDYTSAQYFGFASFFVLAGFIRQVRCGLRLLHIYIITYIAMAAIVPFPSYDRYLIPLIPFLLVFLTGECGKLMSLIKKELTKNGPVINRISAALIGLALMISAGAVFHNYFSEVYQRLRPQLLPESPKPALEDAEAITWINEHTDSSDVLVCYRDPLYFLYTGRKTSRSLPMEEWVDWRDDKTSIETIEKLFFRTLERDNGRYLVVTSTDFDQEDLTGQYRAILSRIVDRHPERFVPVFNSTDGLSKIFGVEHNRLDSIQ